MYLLEGGTYYIKVHGYGMASAAFQLFANLQRVVKINTLTEAAEYTYTLGSGEGNFFRFTPDTTGTYKFYTTASTGDPYLELYDQNMILLTVNDNGGGGENAQIAFTLQAGKTYYIKLKNTLNAAGNGNICFTAS